MRFPYCVRSNKGLWALDIIPTPDEQKQIGKEVVVNGRILSVGGIEVLTEVSIDGQRIQTGKEWSAVHHNDFDPFAAGSEVPTPTNAPPSDGKR